MSLSSSPWIFVAPLPMHTSIWKTAQLVFLISLCMPCCLNAPTDWMTCLQSDVYSVQCIVCPALNVRCSCSCTISDCCEMITLSQYHKEKHVYFYSWWIQRIWFSFLCRGLFLKLSSGWFIWWYLLQGDLTGCQTSLSPHRLVTFERYENDFACMTPGLSYSYSIKSMNKPSVCFPADKVIAIDLQATRVMIMKSVCRHTMNVEQSVCLPGRR